MNNVINVAQYESLSEVNGPGRRAVLWVQGCPKRCHGCWNPDFLRFHDQGSIPVSTLVDRIKDDVGKLYLDGLTLSGGEPFAHAGPLSNLLAGLKDFQLGTFAFSGYTLAEIKNLGTDAERLLSLLDVLVDGEYRDDLKKPLLWRSSQNQKVHFLTERYSKWKDLADAHTQEFEVTIDSGSTRLTGFPTMNILHSLHPTRKAR